MTSHLLDGLKKQTDRRHSSGPCVFCDIIERRQSAYIISDSTDCIAFLDILPIRAGHVLVVPVNHVKSISELEPRQSAALMSNVVSIARAMEKDSSQPRICSSCGSRRLSRLTQVHFHIVPAPLPEDSASPLQKWNTPGKLALLGRRDELSDEEGEDLASRLRTAMGSLSKL